MTLPAGHVAYTAYHRARNANPISHTIRLLHPDTWCNHVSGFYAPPHATKEELLGAVLIEALGRGVTGPGWGGRTLAEAVAADEIEVYRQHPVSPDEEAAGHAWLMRQIGKGYDYPGLLGFLPLTILRKPVLAQQKRESSARWWCSELMMARSQKRGLPALINAEPYQVDPESLRWSPLQTFVVAWRKS